MSGAEKVSVLVQRIIQASKPIKVNGCWRKPELSGMTLAKARKLWNVQELGPWPLEKERGMPNKPPKGHKHERLKAERLKTIDAKLQLVDQQVEEFREKQRLARQKRRLSRQILAPAPKP